ncbi:MAG TPA: hypothetical protein VMV86_02915 [Methanosarcinales archaeon]|nr:hypothetical protein [Methanosarcinales archaeon]
MKEEQFKELMDSLERIEKALGLILDYKPFATPFTFAKTEWEPLELEPPCTCADKGKTTAISPCPRHDKS